MLRWQEEALCSNLGSRRSLRCYLIFFDLYVADCSLFNFQPSCVLVSQARQATPLGVSHVWKGADGTPCLSPQYNLYGTYLNVLVMVIYWAEPSQDNGKGWWDLHSGREVKHLPDWWRLRGWAPKGTCFAKGLATRFDLQSSLFLLLTAIVERHPVSSVAAIFIIIAVPTHRDLQNPTCWL